MTWKTHPKRRSLPFEKWPKPDQDAWQIAVAEGDILDGVGPGSSWAEATRRTNIQHYGRWLGYIKYTDGPFHIDTPADRVSPDSVKAYSSHLKTLVAPITRLSMLVGLKEVIRAMTPDTNWRWLQDYCNAIQRQAKPSKDKRRLVRSSGEIYQAALAELAHVLTEPETLENRLIFRNTLMLALCAARPLRVRNLGGIVIGKNLLRSGDRWLLVFREDETKTGEPLEYFVPQSLVPLLEHYLISVRPSFPCSGENDDLWLSKDGPCKDKRFPYPWIRKTTERLIGTAMNPHLLRDCVATDLAENSPDSIGAAAIMLGHRHLGTTEKYYVHAKNLHASRKINRILEDIKSSIGAHQ